jgi:hypothetical protein
MLVSASVHRVYVRAANGYPYQRHSGKSWLASNDHLLCHAEKLGSSTFYLSGIGLPSESESANSSEE